MRWLIFKKVVLIFLTYLYTLALWYAYVNIIQPLFAYQGFRYFPPTDLELALLLVFVALPALVAPQLLTNISTYFYFLSYYFIYIPTTLMFTFHYSDFTWLQVQFFTVLLVAQIIAAFFAHAPTIKIITPRFARLIGASLFIFVGFVIFGFLLSKFGFRPPPSPFDPYATRLAAREYGALVGYALRIAGNVIAPTLMILGLANGFVGKYVKARFLIFISLILFTIVYSFDGTKSTIFAPALIYALFYIYKRRLAAEKVLIFLLLLIVVSVLLDIYIRKPVFTSFIVRRLMLAPGFLSVLYHEYFVQSQNPIFMYSYSFLGSFFDNPYSTTPAFLIGYTYFGSEVVSANANLYADAVANLGVWGIPVVAFLASLYLYIIRMIAAGCEGAALLLTAVPVFAMVNTSFFTTILTHGLFLSSLLVAFIPRNYLNLICTNGNVQYRTTSQGRRDNA